MRFRLLCSALALAALAACGRAEEEWPYAVTRSGGVVIVTELPEAETRLRNAVTDQGAFLVEKGCLQVRTDAGVFTPALPRGSSFDGAAQAIVVGERRVELGRRYSLPFASELGSEEGAVAEAIGLPRDCARRLLSMGAPA